MLELLERIVHCMSMLFYFVGSSDHYCLTTASWLHSERTVSYCGKTIEILPQSYCRITFFGSPQDLAYVTLHDEVYNSLKRGTALFRISYISNLGNIEPLLISVNLAHEVAEASSLPGGRTK